MKFFFCVIGMVMIVEGLPYFAFPDRMRQMIAQVLGMDTPLLRKFGLFMMLVGLGVVYLAMKGI